MITKSEWQAANRRLMLDARQRAGEPPTADEVLAYSRGELSSEDEARVRELLVAYPELLRTITEPFPDAAEPGDPDYMSEEEFGRHWAAMRKRMRRPGGRVVELWRYSTAIAAAVALTFGVLYWQAAMRAIQPRVISGEQVILPDGHRGPQSATVLAAGGENVKLIIPLIGPQPEQRYRLEIANSASSKAIWKSGAIVPLENDTFELVLPRRFLVAGDYQVIVYDISGAMEQRFAVYSLHVPGRS